MASTLKAMVSNLFNGDGLQPKSGPQLSSDGLQPNSILAPFVAMPEAPFVAFLFRS